MNNVLSQPFYNPDLDDFYMTFLKCLRNAKNNPDIDVNSTLSITMEGVDKVFNLNLSEIGHVSFELLNLERLSKLEPVALLKNLYVISDLDINKDSSFKIKVDSTSNEITLTYGDSKYTLEDFSEFYRTMLKHSIINILSSITPEQRVELLGYGRSFTFELDAERIYSLVYETE